MKFYMKMYMNINYRFTSTVIFAVPIEGLEALKWFSNIRKEKKTNKGLYNINFECDEILDRCHCGISHMTILSNGIVYACTRSSMLEVDSDPSYTYCIAWVILIKGKL